MCTIARAGDIPGTGPTTGDWAVELQVVHCFESVAIYKQSGRSSSYIFLLENYVKNQKKDANIDAILVCSGLFRLKVVCSRSKTNDFFYYSA